MLDHPAHAGPVIRLHGGLVSNQCALCGRSIRAPAGILQHQRGRTGPDGSHAPLRLAGLAWEELEALGICECGQSLDAHPPLPRPKPLSSGRALADHWRGYMPGSTFRCVAGSGNG